MYVSKLFFYVATYLVYSMFVGSDIIAPEVNREDKLNQQQDTPFIVYARDYMQPCFADYVPHRAEIESSFTVGVAQNEYEPIQVGIYVPSQRKYPLRNVSLTIHSNIQYEIGCLYYLETARSRQLDQGQVYEGRRPAMPVYLIPKNRINKIEPGRSAAFWITFHPDATVQPGQYEIPTTISVEGEKPRTFSLHLTVHSLILPRPDAAFGCYYRIDRIAGCDVPVEIEVPYRGRKYQEMYALDMAKHGHNTVQITSFFPGFGTDSYQQSGRAKPPSWYHPWLTLMDESDFTDDGLIDPIRFIEEQLEIYKQVGLISLDIPIWTVSEGSSNRKAFVADTLRRIVIDKKYPEILLYQRDEPPVWPDETFSKEEIEHVKQFKKLGNCRGVAAMGGSAVLAWGHLHDVWIVYGGRITPEMVAEAERQGAEVWTYLHDLRITNPLAHRYFAGLYTWGLRLNGNLVYCYQHGEVGQPHPVWLSDQHRPSKEQILGLVIPSQNGPIPGVGYEGRREGIDDYRYLQLLESRITVASLNSPIRNEAEKWLTELRERIVQSAIDGKLFNHVTVWDLDWLNPSPDLFPHDYYQIRQKTLQYISQLEYVCEEDSTAQMLGSRSFPVSGLEGTDYEDESITTCIQAIENGAVESKRSAACALALRNFGTEEALEALVLMLDFPDVRIPAIRAIRSMGVQAISAMPAVGRLLQNTDPFIRAHALLTLEAIGMKAAEGLIRGLKDPFPMNAYLAAVCLGRQGEVAIQALPALRNNLKSPIYLIRQGANKAIQQIDKK
ncbi:TPA: hypothetical protein EYN98_30030 [Candidatus Poribacteria bacterium]|nr:hypothetical protein [Candidatus Poribacteria bacterium]HIB86192.1 hypothetical protein [Candidatus Poribacteria bacterium]HIN28015.1 hypothetical protein [Candidatus Poribacteria bacterium]HIO05358.1 hypothetical protein [Candidatus Poribacteria bacterium]HIO48451.1 hypothetical protein [Candidatus Poribacteria bacterium]